MNKEFIKNTNLEIVTDYIPFFAEELYDILLEMSFNGYSLHISDTAANALMEKNRETWEYVHQYAECDDEEDYNPEEHFDKLPNLGITSLDLTNYKYSNTTYEFYEYDICFHCEYDDISGELHSIELTVHNPNAMQEIMNVMAQKINELQSNRLKYVLNDNNLSSMLIEENKANNINHMNTNDTTVAIQAIQ